ncbi:MAG TPA: response regulator transcription factor [Gemmatimonadaceae bacterium]|nr:response regulator transcription factor [Gemmatimonadaceae bacterium]
MGRSPDVLVLDGRAPVGGQAPVIALVDDPATEAAAALRAGARAVLRRDTSAPELVAAIEAVAAGLVVLHPDAVPRPAAAAATTPDAAEPLTRREREILTLLADGLGNKAIAARLGISDHTVKAHVGAIFDKLHVGTRAEAVALGLRLGLIAL